MNASSRKKRTPCSTDMSSACSRMQTIDPRQTDQRFGELAERDRRGPAAEAGLDHHLLAVVRPALDERQRREHDRLAGLRLDAPQVLVVQEVAGIHLVNRDRPERRDVEVAQVLFLPLERPAALGVGEVVVRRRGRLRLERARRPHAGERPAIEVGRRRPPSPCAAAGIVTMALALEERPRARRAGRADGLTSSPGRRVPRLAAPPRPAIGSPPFMRPATRPELLLRRLQLARGDRQQALDGQRRCPSSSAASARTSSRPRRNERAGLRGHRRCRGDRCRRRAPARLPSARRRDRRAGADRRRPANARGRSCSMNFSAPRHRLDAQLDEDARRLLDVVARGLDEPRRLPELREDAARALGRRRVGNSAWPARLDRQNVGVVPAGSAPSVRTVLQLEASARGRGRRGSALEALDAGQLVAVDLVQPPEKPGQRPHLALDRRPPEVFEQIVVRVHAVQRRAGGMGLVQVAEVVVDEMRKGLGWIHDRTRNRQGPRHEIPAAPPWRTHRAPAHGLQIRQWYNKCPFPCPASLFSSPRRSATSRT